MSNDNFDYIEEANVTASNNFHGDKVPLYHFQGVLNDAIKALEALDKIKKALFYGRDLVGLPERHDVVTGCQQLPFKIDSELQGRGELILHSIVGKATEVGEQLEQLFDVLFNGVFFDEVNFVEEIGDGQWYDAIGLRAVGVTFDECQRRNIAKLRHRFPNAFTEFDANNRDLFGERRILEMQDLGKLGDGKGGYISPMDMPKASLDLDTPQGMSEANAPQKQQCTIENWMHFGNVLIGDVVGHARLGDAKGCRTSTIIRLDESAGICETKNTIYKLGNKANSPENAKPSAWCPQCQKNQPHHGDPDCIHLHLCDVCKQPVEY